MMELQPIETAPKDGTWVLLFGGRTNEEAGEVTEADITRPVVGFWDEDIWAFAHWDSGWGGSYYDNPTHWLSLQSPPAKVEGVRYILLVLALSACTQPGDDRRCPPWKTAECQSTNASR